MSSLLRALVTLTTETETRVVTFELRETPEGLCWWSNGQWDRYHFETPDAAADYLRSEARINGASLTIHQACDGCGSTRESVAMDARDLGIADPVCCEVSL